MGGKGGIVIGCGAAQPSSSYTAQRSAAQHGLKGRAMLVLHCNVTLHSRCGLCVLVMIPRGVLPVADGMLPTHTYLLYVRSGHGSTALSGSVCMYAVCVCVCVLYAQR